MWKRAGAVFVLALIALTAPPIRAADEPYDLYAILSLTGPAAFIGTSAKTTLGAFQKWANLNGGIRGRPLNVVIADDQSNPDTAVQLADQLFAKGIPAVIGPNFGATCSAVLPRVRNGPVLYCLANVIHPPAGSYAFVANLSTKDFTAAGFRYLQAGGVRKIALLTTTDASGQDGEAVALENLKSPEFRNLQLVANEHFAPGDLSVSAQMARIKASGAQALDAWTTGTPFGTVLRNVQEAGWNGIVMTNGGNVNTQQMKQYADFIPTQMILTASPYVSSNAGLPPGVLAMRATFLAAMHDVGIATPDTAVASAWDPTLIIVSGLRQLGPNATATQLRDYILKLHDFAGLNGMYDFRRGDQHGLDPLSSPLVRWDKTAGTFVLISKPGGMPLSP